MGRHDAALLIRNWHQSAKSALGPRGDWPSASYALTNPLQWSSFWGALHSLNLLDGFTNSVQDSGNCSLFFFRRQRNPQSQNICLIDRRIICTALPGDEL